MHFQLIVVYLGLVANLVLQTLDVSTSSLCIDVAYYKYNLSLEMMMVAGEIVYFWMLVHFDLNFFELVEAVV